MNTGTYIAPKGIKYFLRRKDGSYVYRDDTVDDVIVIIDWIIDDYGRMRDETGYLEGFWVKMSDLLEYNPEPEPTPTSELVYTVEYYDDLTMVVYDADGNILWQSQPAG